VVLVRPRNPENLGAVARAMKNFELEDWAIVALGTHDFATARRVAVHAEELLDRPRLAATLDEAVADCTWVVGKRPQGARQAAAAPEEVGGRRPRARPGSRPSPGEERSGSPARSLTAATTGC
jgi:tRNA/rRNA methyltransferase